MDTLSPQPEDGRPSPPRIITPSQWFAQKFPLLPDLYGVAILEQIGGSVVLVKGMNEDFLAATLGEKGSPDAPTVYIPAEKRFYTYSQNAGIFDHRADDDLIAGLSELLLRCARACPAGCDTRALEFQLRNATKLSGVLRKARALLQVPNDYFADDLAKFIPCANGMLRLDDKALLPFSPTYRRRNKLAVPFEAGAKCPVFLDTLMRAALDDDDLDLLQRWCGLPLIGENLAQKILILTGTAGGGKGTFVRVLAGVIGEPNIASLRTHLLNERFEIGRFLGKTLLYGADVPQNFLNQKGASVLKALTGYDQVTLEFKNSNETPYIICRFPIITTSNSRLIVHLEDDAEAWRRRLAIVEYRKPKPGNVVAELHKRILETEASGVLNFMLDGLDKLRAHDWQLILTSRQQRLVDNLLLESASHAVFLRECLMLDPQGKLIVTDCHAAYAEYCHNRGWAAQPRNKFGPLAEDLLSREFGVTIRKDIIDANGLAQAGWKKIRIKTEFDQVAGEI